MILSDEERDKFATYLEESADSDMKIAEQLGKLNDQMKDRAMFALESKMRAESMAAKVIAVKLRRTKTETKSEPA
jgi:hypothetical protein